jgi:hypothetical protein
MADFFSLVGSALALDRSALAAAATAPGALRVAMLIALLGGASLMLGQSVILFANRVSRRRFATCLGIAGLVYVAGLVAWAVTIWLSARLVFRLDIPVRTIMISIGIGQAPLVFGFLCLFPAIGSSLQRILVGYSLLVVVAALSAVLGMRVWQAGLLAAAGWFFRAGLDRLLNRPLAGARAWLWRASTGRATPITRQEALATLTSDRRSWAG